MLVNNNKLKPYKSIEEQNLQLVLVKFDDLVINKLIQTKEHVPLSIEPKDFQPIGFELVSNHLTLSKIKAINVFVHHYHNLPIQDNNVAVNNNPNDMFRKAFIDAYLLGVPNLKGYVYSQP